jgi:pyruvate dehydrogenase E2 component (dihydrolipoamide acetyltransferase)
MRLAGDDEGAGDALVLLHGVATSRLIWRRVLEPLARGRRVIAVDVPGFGESAPAGPGFDLDAVADRLVDGLEPGRFDLVGHSLGGAVAVAAAARHPEAIRRLVLVAPAGLEPRATRVAAALGAAADRAIQVRRAFGYQLAGRARGRQVMFGATVADAGRLHPDDARLLIDASTGARRVAAGVQRALEADLRDDLVAARMPVGVIWGTADRVVPYTGLEAIRALRPDAVVETIRGSGHIPQIERPPEFVAALERILAKLTAA